MHNCRKLTSGANKGAPRVRRPGRGKATLNRKVEAMPQQARHRGARRHPLRRWCRSSAESRQLQPKFLGGDPEAIGDGMGLSAIEDMRQGSTCAASEAGW
jgi:hypothetical protein